MAIAPALPALTAIGTAVSVASTVMGAIGQKRVADQQARRERQLGQLEADRLERERDKHIGRIRASLSAAGIDPGAGTPLLVFADTEAEAELERLNALVGADTRSLRARQQGTQALAGGIGKAGSTLLTAASAFKDVSNGPYT